MEWVRVIRVPPLPALFSKAGGSAAYVLGESVAFILTAESERERLGKDRGLSSHTTPSEAIQNPSDEALQEAAWEAVVHLVITAYAGVFLEAALHSLLGALTSETYDDPTQHLEREQALAKQFAEILHFTLRFDELKALRRDAPLPSFPIPCMGSKSMKMTNPAIQNDFSYYRRTLSRMRINNTPAEGENEVNNEMANRISLFYADATPMLKTLSDSTTKFVSENKNLPIENTTDCLSTMASMKGCIKVLRDQPPNSVEGLLNALRYTTKHLNDESTNKTIKSMLQQQ
ncbi:unnamed protein product [Coregonus sp. 'balchen']|nr:unnamed protein product [Coregonus sp. 'balchen']